MLRLMGEDLPREGIDVDATLTQHRQTMVPFKHSSIRPRLQRSGGAQDEVIPEFRQ
jgi:hypothetical protein